MNPNELLNLFREKGAYLEGHFVLSSGLHSSNYMQCARILQFPSIAETLGHQIADGLPTPDFVLSPALGGIIIGHEVARAYGVPFLFCEREDKVFRLRRGFEIQQGQHVVVIEDVMTTGGSTRETIAVAQQASAVLAGTGCIVDRSLSPLDFGVPFHSLLKLPLAQYKPDDCVLCRQGIPVIKPGSRK